MANKIYQNNETAVDFNSAGSVVWSWASVAFGAGRKSAQWDRGAGAQAKEFTWFAKTKLQATPVVGETIDLYLARSNDGTAYEGGLSAGDGAFTDEDALNNMLFIGSIVVDTTTTDAIHAGGTFNMDFRYGVLVIWNATAAETLSATAGDHDFDITPTPDEVQ